MAGVLEKFLFEKKSLSELLTLLNEPRLNFCYPDILKNIEGLLAKGCTLTDDERNCFTAKLLDVTDDIFLSHRIIKMLWSKSGELKVS